MHYREYRLYVQSGVYDKFTEMLVEKTKALKVGHGATDGHYDGSCDYTSRVGQG